MFGCATQFSIMVRNRTIAVTSVAFSKDSYLRGRLLEGFPKSFFNLGGKKLSKPEVREFLSDADGAVVGRDLIDEDLLRSCPDRKSTRLNSSHRCISYAVFCLKKKRV